MDSSDDMRVNYDATQRAQEAASAGSFLHQRMREDLPDRQAVCAAHGEYTAKGWILMGRREIWSPCPGCEAERKEAEAREIAERSARAMIERHARLIGDAGIPPRFHGRTFDAFKADTDAKRRALTIARDFAEDFKANMQRGSGLVFAGLPGTGKSHLASGVILSLLGTFSARYTTCMRMIRSVRDTWRKDSEVSELAVMRHWGEELDLLVIDEVGATYGTEGEQTLLFEVMDRRYAAMRPTILLTNQDKDGFKEYVGDRVFDRLRETSRWVAFDWPSHRGQQREPA